MTQLVRGFPRISMSLWLAWGGVGWCVHTQAGLLPTALTVEYLSNPRGIEAGHPRLGWRVESAERAQRQTAYRVLVASIRSRLDNDEGDLWDSGRVSSDQTAHVPYAGKPLRSRQACFWKVQAWDRDGHPSPWSEVAEWSMGLLEPDDWTAAWIAQRDATPLHTNRNELHLPPAQYYRKPFQVSMPVARATIYVSALGIYELHLNGHRVGDAWFTPGWADYHRRTYYNTYDVTPLLGTGTNGLGAIVADGWYAGYVGYGLLVGYGPHKTGRSFYGKTPALRVQLEIEYQDGTCERVATDSTWEVASGGPLREADLIMGETFDARLDRPGWWQAGQAPDWRWQPAVPAETNGSTPALFSDTLGERLIDLGFHAPDRLQSYSGPPIRVTAELPARRVTEPKPGVFVFDLGQNFAGVIRLKVRGAAGTQVQIRYGEMLHPDGRLMTENLRRARATDGYVLRGDPDGETWAPRFTYHGFQYVELTGLADRPGLDAVTGLVVHSDTPLTGDFACSDEVLTRFWHNTVWTQRANFVEIPTDCPQRDERLGWMGDAQVYVRAATYNADVAAFFTKWLDDVEEAQREFGAYPDYCPYPMAHGTPYKTFGTAWTDAGIICPWTMYWVYGDTEVIRRHWASMQRFMDFRAATTTPEGLGTSIGNPWGDWLALGETTPIDFIDTCYHALDCQLMSQMAEAIDRPVEAANYRRRFDTVRAAFLKQYLRADGTLSVATQTADVLAIGSGLLIGGQAVRAAERLAANIRTNDYRMATGFLGTKALLPVLTGTGHHDLAVRLFQSRRFPSWGYEVVNGATTVWERWDSYTKEDGFGRHNAAMNSFSHYSFGAVTEWIFRDLAGIETDGPGFQRLKIRPAPPSPGSNPENPPIDWVRAEYASRHGKVRCAWRQRPDRFALELTLPANTQATVYLPAASSEGVVEGGQPLAQAQGVQLLRMDAGRAVLAVGSGSYQFEARR